MPDLRPLLLLPLAGGLGCTYTVREAQLFYPRRAPDLPQQIQRQDIAIPFETGTLRGSWVKHPQARLNIIYFYGNGELLNRSLPRLQALSERFQAHVFCFDYRGYGESDGRPTLRSLQEDALRIWDDTTPLRVGRPTVVASFSIGTWAAVHLASHRPVDAMVLQAPFSCFEDIAPAVKRLGPWWTKPFLPFVSLNAEPGLRELTEPLQEMPRVQAPVVLIQGEKDRLMPMRCGRRMHGAAGSSHKHLVIVPGADHNDLSLLDEPALSRVDELLKQIRPAS